MVNLDLPKVSQMTINTELLKVSKMTSLKIYIVSSYGEAKNTKFGQPINPIQNVSLVAPSRKVVTSLPHNYVINLFISSYRGATVIIFRQ